MPPPVFRFAPSPNGYLHLGHAYSALLNFDLARQAGGRFLLRIEDIDGTRCRPEFEAAIYEDLAWLGLSWETPVRRQSGHFAGYREVVEKLSAQGLVYPSFESRAEIARLVAQRETAGTWPRDPDGAPLYPGAALSLSAEERARLIDSGAPYALRLDMAAAHARAGNLTWIEQGEGPAGETGAVPCPAGSLGRRHPGAQGDADQLPSVGRDRRCPAGRHRGGAGAGPVLVDERAPVVAGSARYPATGLPASPPDPRFHRAEAVEIDPVDRVAGASRRGRHAGRYSLPRRPAIILFWQLSCQFSAKRPP